MTFLKICRTGHAYLSLFFLPMAFLYAVTGVCYISGHTGKLVSARYTAALDTPPPVAAEAKLALVRNVLAANGVSCPAGDGKEMRDRFTIGAPTGRHAVLEPLRENAKEATVSVNTPSLFSIMVLLHKAKGGAAFNFFGSAFGAALLLMYLSGFLLFWTSPDMRKKLLLCCAAGLVATAMAILLSI